ncbi:hypothetical protein CB1_001399002 [Camelus ferus]|nr:hypothetical protein CB1_001399002 [Camelus ferus]
MAEEGAVAVCVRVRPLNSREEALGKDTQVYWKTDNNTIYQVDGSKSFNFDRVFHSNETTKNVYEEIAVPIIDSAIQGYNGTIFAYGQTASGKTYTMMGSQDYLGVIPRAIHDIFQKIKKFPDREFLLRVSYMEIYNETITDLLCDTQKMKPLIIREDFNRNVYVADLTEEVVYTSEMALKWITKGEKNRHYGITKMNQRSSRSHTIFRMILESREKGEPSNFEGSVKVSHLFASTAKYMKNTPYVNEVSSDEALLKRYRKEIMDLKKQLEEVSLETRAQAMEKDQLAQLLEEKDLLQKVQIEKIQNLTRMLVTSSSLTSQQELKESLESELSSLRANYDNLVLDYEQLRKENEEMELKLKEKNDLDEFEALERKAEKDQEMQLIHEISNLKNLVKHAEVYNQDLENELSSKVELLREKEDQIKKLQKYVDSQKSGSMKMDLSYSSENTEDLKQMKQTLLDAETVALDAKRESAFLRSENLKLKEKMKELASTCKQMENDMQLCQRQLEAKKKMQVDLEKELQSSFNEITKLTSLIDGKVPKDLLCNLELERNITNLQRELNKEVEENEALRKEVTLLSELKSVPSEVEMLRKELHDKSEELCIITSEKDKLFSEVVHKESRIQDLLKEIGKTENNLATSQLNYESTDQEFQDFKNHDTGFEQKYKMVLEENARLNQEIGNLSKEAQELGLSLGDLKTELSHKTQELEKKTTEHQERLKEVEELKEQLESRDSRLHTVEKEKTLITEKLQQALVEVKTLTQEKDDQKQLQESLRIERDQLRSDIQDTVNMTIENQEELRILGDELKKQQERVTQEKNHAIKKEEELFRTCEKLAEVEEKLKEKNQQLQEKQQQLLSVREEMSEMQKKMSEVENLKNELKNQELSLECIKIEKLELAQQLHENYEEMKFITKERDNLKELQESFETERSKLKGYIREIEVTELLPNVKEVSDTQETVDQLELLKGQSKAKDSATLADIEMERLRLTENLQDSLEEIKSLTKERDNLKMTNEALQVERDELKEEIKETLAKIQASQNKQEQSFNMEEKDNEIKKIMSETDQLKEQLKAKDSALLRLEMEKLKLSERLQKSHDEVKSTAKERDDLQRLQEVLQSERNQLQENIREMIAKHLEMEEELQVAYCHLKEQEETIDKLRVDLSERETEISSIQKKLETTNDALQKKTQELHERQEQFIRIKEVSETEENMSELEQLKEHLKAEDSSLQRIENERLELTERLQASQEEIKTIIKERDELKRVQEALQMERDQLKENIKEIVAEGQKIKDELKTTYGLLKEYQETINAGSNSEKTDQGANIQRDSGISDDELQEKVQELQEEEHQLLKMKDVSETQDKMCGIENFKQQLEAQKSALENTEMENRRLTQRLHKHLEEIKSVTKERDDLRSVEETLKVERDQLNENLRETIIKDLEKQEELRIAHMSLKEHQETINKLKGTVSEKTDEISNIQVDLENTKTAFNAQIQELQEKEDQLLKVKNDLRESMDQTEQLKKQLQAQASTHESIETEKLRLTQKLHENIEEIKSVTKERDDLRRMEGILKMERDQLRESLRETEAKIQELKANEHQLFKLKEGVSETQKKMCEMERLKKEFKAQSLTLNKIEMENLNLAQKLHESLEEMKSVMKERDDLRRAEETLRLERDRLKADLQGTIARAIMNESTEFEERNATIGKEWEHDLKSMKENNEKLFKDFQTLRISLTSGALVNPTTQDDKNLHVTSRATQQATEDKVALGAKPYKEEIEDLKTKLVKTDLEKMKTAKEFEKEYVFALTEHDFNSLNFL